MTKRALVLSGGGSKGAYEVGVMLALRKLNMEYQIVTGTSVGALNGLFAVQKDIYQAYNLWKSINFSTVYNKDLFEKFTGNNFEIYKKYVKNVVKDGGIEISGLEATLNRLFNPGKFYGSNIDYGLVTYNLTRRKPVFLTKKDLPQEKIKDYVIASATCFPVFKPKEIDGDLYIDGGYYDNLPINLAAQLGAEEVVAVDLRAVGFKKKVNKDGISITYISPRNKIVSFLIFDKDLSQQALNFGYNDTLKTFEKFDGNKFTFKNKQLKKAYKKYNKLLMKQMKRLEIEDKLIYKVVSNTFYKKILKDDYDAFVNVVEQCGFIFEFKEDLVYTTWRYNRKLRKELSKVQAASIRSLLKNINDKKFVNTISRKTITKLFYEVIKMKKINSVSKLIPVFPSEFLAALYLNVIK